MAEWNRRREPDVHDVMTCRGVLRCAATRDAPRRARAPAPPRAPPPPAAAARPTVVVAGLGVAGCAAVARAPPRRRDDAGRDVGALRLSFDGARAPCCDALAELLADVDLYHCDDGLLSRGALARTCERPQGWNGATGQWEHFAH
ncbi:hypothetical protein JL722_8964 [Aureococcus anophagefferens]|nr:hypothetical protein JL722_8964 [Aureococcus anophagefferens]